MLYNKCYVKMRQSHLYAHTRAQHARRLRFRSLEGNDESSHGTNETTDADHRPRIHILLVDLVALVAGNRDRPSIMALQGLRRRHCERVELVFLPARHAAVGLRAPGDSTSLAR